MRLYLKLYLAFAASVALAALVIGGIAFLFSEYRLERRFRGFLEDRSRSVAALVEYVLQNEMRSGGDERTAALRLAGWTGGQAWIFDGQGRLLGASSDAPPPPFAEENRVAGPSRFGHDQETWMVETTLHDGRRALVRAPLAHPYTEGGGLLFVAAMLLVFLILLFPLSCLLGRPLARLREAATRLAAGDLQHRVQIQRRDGLGDLARSFNDMADRIERLLSSARELNAHVSHELRSPLARMRVAIELLRDDAERNPTALAHETIEARVAPVLSEIERLDDLVGRILILSQSGGTAPAVESINLAAALRDALSRSSEFESAERLQLEIQAPHSAVVRGDRRWIEAAIQNLCQNALRYAPDGDRLNFSLRAVEDGWLLETENAAILAESELSELARPFRRGESAARRTEGAGLGLAIVDNVARVHHGWLRLQWAQGRLRVALWLPQEPNLQSAAQAV
ncbi:MAG: HAMP domain-containing protein [Leptospirales bacterium]|nr:HAMP domain-containing protein [Leptospirales bacterium]